MSMPEVNMRPWPPAWLQVLLALWFAMNAISAAIALR